MQACRDRKDVLTDNLHLKHQEYKRGSLENIMELNWNETIKHSERNKMMDYIIIVIITVIVIITTMTIQ